MADLSRVPSAVLAQDEPVLRDKLRYHLSELWPQLRIVGEAATGIEALDLLERHSPDVMFLDIKMPMLTGLDVAQQAQGRCHIAFLTAYDAHAIAAFDAAAVDYVLEPLERDRLRLGVERLQQRLASVPPNLEVVLRELTRAAMPRNYARWLNASAAQSVQVISVDEVLYFQADAPYVRVVTATCEAVIRKSLHELRRVLDPAVFWQIHRSTVVNVNVISGVSRDMCGRLLINLKHRNETLALSEAHQHRLRQM